MYLGIFVFFKFTNCMDLELLILTAKKAKQIRMKWGIETEYSYFLKILVFGMEVAS